jgi:anti-sigma factor (TIGR02949 family)
MPNREECSSAVRHLWAHLDGELPDELHARVAAHIKGCRSCQSHFDFERALLAAIRAHVRMPSEADLAPLRARVVRAMFREDAPVIRADAMRRERAR